MGRLPMPLGREVASPRGCLVTLDGHDLRGLEPRWLRQQLGVVRQEPALFAGFVSTDGAVILAQREASNTIASPMMG